MARRASMLLVLLIIPAAALCTVASAAVVEHTFNVGGMGISQLCMNSLIYTVNQQMPGPTIEANEGDTLLVHVINASPYPLSIHWHGVFQLQSGWADGALMITQCPIKPSDSFTYVFTVTGQEGTLWWHAHASMLRATIYGALIIRPRSGYYPFPTPDAEVPILLGEWWNRNVDDVETDGLLTGLGPATSDAFTINGSPGDQAPCGGGAGTFQLEVEPGKTYLLRIINAAVNAQLFFRVAGHAFTVVAADASYTSPYATDVVVVAPGQTVDALMVATAAPSRYYMAARAFESKTVANPPPFDRAVATAVVKYRGVPDSAPAALPALPPYTDVATAGRFYWSLTGLVRTGDPVVPTAVDHSMVVAFGLDTAPCAPDQTKCRGFAIVASMNRYSFRFPDRTSVSLLEALFRGVPNVYSEDFPDVPAPVPRKVTSVRKVNLGDVVEVVLQSEGYSAVLGAENHPIHLHGFNFFVLAQGLGRFDPRMRSTFNLVNPQVRNTVAVPAGGWAVIRFTANNPGMWFMHCHLDAHLPLGLAMVFEVTNGPAPYLLPPPPAGYPKCH